MPKYRRTTQAKKPRNPLPRTEPKQKEEALKAENAFRKAIEDSLLLGIIAVDTEGRQSYINPSFCKMVGWSKEELLGAKPPFVYWPPEEMEKIQKSFKAVLSGKESSGTLELRLQRKNGERFDALVLYSPLRDAHGKLIGWIESIGDITKHKKVEEEIRRLNAELEERVRQRTAELKTMNRELEIRIAELKQTEKKLKDARDVAERERLHIETILETIPSGVVVIEKPDGRVTYVNRRTQELYGKRPRPNLPMPEHSTALKLLTPNGELFPPEELPASIALFKGEIVRNSEVVIEHTDGRRITVSASASPLQNEAGEITGAVGVFHDITEHKRADEEIKRLNEDLKRHTVELETLNKELESFCYAVSHDLKSPLIVVEGFSQRLLERYADKLDARGKKYLQNIYEAGQQMTLLIEDLLRLSRVTQSGMKVKTVDLSELAKSVIEKLQEADPEREVKWIVQEGLVVKGDHPFLGIALENLFGNAWKFTGKRKRATIEFGHIQREAGSTYFVRDNGCGFDMFFADKLFQPFQRFHSAEEFPGTGLGLTTVQRIIRCHGGRIWAESALGKGATFFFTLPS